MNFAEARFWELLFVAAGGILLLRALLQAAARLPRAFDKCALLALGLFLLGAVSWTTLLIFMVVAVGTYAGLAAILRGDPAKRRYYTWVLIPLQLAPLAYYKYADFVTRDVLGLQFDVLRDLAIPVGISFYTFQKIGFVIDTLHHDKALPGVLDAFNFFAFFPQIVAGPIERRDDLLPQIERFRFRWLPADINDGVTWIAVGLFFKCCLADNLALYFDGAAVESAYAVWAATVLFGLRIYYDFAGYSLIALGLARCLGVGLTLNFASPYCATSIAEFWRRWHVTLSQWFRDYLYIPLGGGRVRWWSLNILLVFAASGIWHGAGWNFVLWGGMHGAFLVVSRVLGSRLPLPRAAAWTATMLATFVAWLCFYEVRTPVLLAKLATLVTPAAYSQAALHQMTAQWTDPDKLVLAAILSLAAGSLLLEWRSVVRQEPYALLRRPLVAGVLIVLTVMLAPGASNGFIYFAF